MINRTLILLAVFLATLAPSSALACSPTEAPANAPSPTAINLASRATVIVHGRVIKMEHTTATVEVYSYLRGRGPDVVEINGWNSTSCDPELLHADVEAIFYTTGNPEERLNTVTYRWSAPSPALVTQISAETGQQPMLPDGAGPAPAAPDAPAALAPPQGISVLVIVGALTLVGVGGALLIIHHRRQKSGSDT